MTRIHRLTDNHDIPEDEYAKAYGLLCEVKTFHLASRQYVKEQRLGREVFLPGNIWAGICDLGHFTDWTYDLVNSARCVSPVSGFDLML